MSRGIALRVALGALASIVACDDSAAPERAPSDFHVEVYVESGDSVGMSDIDSPLRATITVESNDADFERVDSTGADGRVAFLLLPTGPYTVSHVATDLPPGIELRGSHRQTVLAPFGGDSVVTRFVYVFTEGALAGVVYRDDDGSDDFDADSDTTFADVPLLLFAGSDTLAAPVATDTTGASGLFAMAPLAAGEYTLLVRVPGGAALVGPNPRPVTIVSAAPLFLPLEVVSASTEAVAAPR